MWPFTRKKAAEPLEDYHMWDNAIEVLHGRVRYSCANATILASHRGEGVCFADYGEVYLCKTPLGNYFRISCQKCGHETRFYTIHPYTLDEAMRSYNRLPDHTCSFKEAFGIDIIDA